MEYGAWRTTTMPFLSGRIGLSGRNGPGCYSDAGASFAKPTSQVSCDDLHHIDFGEHQNSTSSKLLVLLARIRDA